MRHEIRLFETVASYRLSPIPIRGQPALRYRIEILRGCGAGGRFSARVYRDEAYALRPSFRDDVVDEVVAVEDLGDWSEIQFDTPHEALEHVMAGMRARYPHCDFA